MSRYSKSKVKVMLDGETLSQDSFTAPLISLGAVKFLKDGTIVDKFSVNIDAEELIKVYGFKAQKETIKWWMEQNPKALQALQKNAKPLREALQDFLDWYGEESLETWANGIDFDLPIIKAHFKKVDMVAPWKYWDQADYRTVLKLFDLNNQKLRENSSHTYHDAVADCYAQVEILTEILKPLWVNGND